MVGKNFVKEKYYPLIGNKYNSLTIIGIDSSNKSGHYFLRCKCDCGNEKVIRADRVLNNITKTCGCQNKHYNACNPHRLSHKYPKLYSVWNTMRHRCYNPRNWKYKDYGGRGITVCEEWRNNFPNFFNWAMAYGYQEGLTIDRIDVNGNYEPTNCRWATLKQQARNKTNNKMITYNGETKSLVEWCEYLGLQPYYDTIGARIRVGWDVERAFTQPIKHPKQ